MTTVQATHTVFPTAARPGVLLAILLILAVTHGSAHAKQQKTTAAPGDSSILPFKEHYQDPKLHSGAVLPAWLTEKDESRWEMPAKNYASTRYSTLDQINIETVKNLRLAWSFSTGQTNGHEAAPVVVNGIMYVITPYPNIVYALDLARGGALKWKYNPQPNQAAQGVACCDVVNRGLVYADGRILFNTLDTHAVALDARTGRELWKTKLGDINLGETITMAPLVVKGKMLVGNSGGEMGVRGWLKAVDINNGKVAWTAYSTGPDKDVLIGPDFKPFYPKDKGTDLGASSWPPDMWRIGGGGVWGWISYDPEFNLIYYGTGNPGPWNPDQRPGDNKWTLSLFARNPDNGQAAWAYQIEAHDLYDYDGVNELILLDLPVNGEMRKTLVRPERNGHIYVMDRFTGEVLSAETYAHVNVTNGIDLQTGEPRKVEGKETGFGKAVYNICPAAPGAKDWQPAAYSARTGLLYIPHNNLCMDMRGTEANG